MQLFKLVYKNVYSIFFKWLFEDLAFFDFAPIRYFFPYLSNNRGEFILYGHFGSLWIECKITVGTQRWHSVSIDGIARVLIGGTFLSVAQHLTRFKMTSELKYRMKKKVIKQKKTKWANWQVQLLEKNVASVWSIRWSTREKKNEHGYEKRKIEFYYPFDRRIKFRMRSWWTG